MSQDCLPACPPRSYNWDRLHDRSYPGQRPRTQQQPCRAPHRVPQPTPHETSMLAPTAPRCRGPHGVGMMASAIAVTTYTQQRNVLWCAAPHTDRVAATAAGSLLPPLPLSVSLLVLRGDVVVVCEVQLGGRAAVADGVHLLITQVRALRCQEGGRRRAGWGGGSCACGGEQGEGARAGYLSMWMQGGWHDTRPGGWHDTREGAR